MECTYGDKKHERLEDAYDEFVDAINRTVRRGGKVIVPAFAVGRTQNLSYMLSEAIDNGDIADIRSSRQPPGSKRLRFVPQAHRML
jgi:metallo-beta-lactamase family protein